ncbi:hypothetical protein B0O99DRAFT_655954 [Bisporella sp. PMI_857]|nr:hypothetical protein B0O99DRAFT_655954 [Bisporella sp. PMI_857]
MAGETGSISVSLPIAMVIAGFFAISCSNVIEILILIFSTFKSRTGLYFWSMIVASLGIPVHAVAVLLRYFRLAPDFPMCVITVIGWYAMVTGQAVVLYSRLHLVVSDDRKIRWVLIMIITNVCILHLPVTVLFLGSNLGNDNLLKPFIIYEKIQLTGFCIQEFIISGLYIWETIHALKPVLAIKGPNERKVIRHLILINVLIVLLDISLLITEYTDNFHIQTTYKTAVYSIKLKMEFTVLNQLLYVFQSSNCAYCHIPESNPIKSYFEKAKNKKKKSRTSVPVSLQLASDKASSLPLGQRNHSARSGGSDLDT